MPRLREDRAPSYREHKPTRRAVVTLTTSDGGKKDIYLGPYDSPESHEAYAHWIGLWRANGRMLPVESDFVTLTKLAFKFLDHAEGFYRKGERATSTLKNYRIALDRLMVSHGQLLVEEFDAKTFAEHVASLESTGLSRTTINKELKEVRRVFAWGVTKGLVEPQHALALKLVGTLARGRTRAPEGRKVRAVGAEEFRETIARVPGVVRDMALVQWLTGMRPGEVCRLRPASIDRAEEIWIYVDADHKLAHLDEHDRLVPLNRSAQRVLQPYLDACGDPDAYVFPPLSRSKHRSRSTPWSVDAYGEALERGWLRSKGIRERDWKDPARRSRLEAAHGKPWRPNRIRHAAAVAVQRADGREAARIVLGHGSQQMTKTYAKADLDRLRASSSALEDPGLVALSRYDAGDASP